MPGWMDGWVDGPNYLTYLEKISEVHLYFFFFYQPKLLGYPVPQVLYNTGAHWIKRPLAPY